MRAYQPRALFFVTTLQSLLVASCFVGGGGGGHGGGGNKVAVFQISKTHAGNFRQGQQNATYTITVSNIGNAATAGPVQVSDTLPSGETLVSMTAGPGAGWSFPGGPVATRSDALGPGASWPPITVTVNVANNATDPQLNTATVSGGGAEEIANAQDSTPIIFTASVLFGQYAFLFSGFDANGAVAVAGSIHVDQDGNVTGEEDFKDPTTLLTAQPVSGSCRNYAVASTGYCQLTAAGRTYQYDFVLRRNMIAARFFENPADGLNINGSGLLLAQQVPNSNAVTTPGGFNGYFSVDFVGTNEATPAGRIGVVGNIFWDLNGTVYSPPGVPSQADVNDNGTLIQPSPLTVGNVVGAFAPTTVDANGRATMHIVIGTSPLQRTLTLAVYVVAPVNSTTNNNNGRAFAIDVTPIGTSPQVLTGQFFWEGAITPAYSSSSISGVNAFVVWGVVPGTPGPPTMTASSNTVIGIFTPSALLFDVNSAGQVNGGGTGLPPPLTGTVNSISVASNGRAVLSATVGSTIYTYVLYLDVANDGNLLGATVGGSPDPTVGFGAFTGQVPTSGFDNTSIRGSYVVGSSMPVLATVPNGASPVTLTPTTSSGTTFNGTFSSGQSAGMYSFDQTTGRGTGLTSQGTVFENSNFVFYIIAPNIMFLMGADQGNPADAIAFLQH